MDLKEIKINFKKIGDNAKLDSQSDTEKNKEKNKEKEKNFSNFLLPTGKYELKYITNDSNKNPKDEFILNEGDKFIILKFTWTDEDEVNNENEQNQNIQSSISNMQKGKKIFKNLRFIIGVEYLRTEPIDIEYEMEVKFRIK